MIWVDKAAIGAWVLLCLAHLLSIYAEERARSQAAEDAQNVERCNAPLKTKDFLEQYVRDNACKAATTSAQISQIQFSHHRPGHGFRSCPQRRRAVLAGATGVLLCAPFQMGAPMRTPARPWTSAT